jgi:hypothetical protein
VGSVLCEVCILDLRQCRRHFVVEWLAERPPENSVQAQLCRDLFSNDTQVRKILFAIGTQVRMMCLQCAHRCV